MKLTVTQLRQIIKEEIENKSAGKLITKIVPRGVYFNDKGHEVEVVFLMDDDAAWILLKNGKRTNKEDGTVSELAELLKAGKFEFDHKTG